MATNHISPTGLFSITGLVGSAITIGTRTGRITDLVVRPDASDTYPDVTGYVIRLGRQTLFAPAAEVTGFAARRRTLLATVGELEPFDRHEGDVLLAADVLDRQIVDTDGIHVIRAADLYLAVIAERLRLVALDTSVRTLIRRLGPRRLRERPAPQRVIDWSHIEAFGRAPEVLHLCAPATEIGPLRAGELATIVHDLAGAWS